jgi:hypothetical protein
MQEVGTRHKLLEIRDYKSSQPHPRLCVSSLSRQEMAVMGLPWSFGAGVHGRCTVRLHWECHLRVSEEAAGEEAGLY